MEMLFKFVLFAVVFGALVVVCMCAWRDNNRFLEEWPPISDDEFLARCAPGTSRDTALRVRRIVSEQLGVEYERVYPEQEFVRDLGCD